MIRALVLVFCATTAVGAETQRDPEVLKHFVHQDCGSCHGMTLKGGLGPDIRVETLQHYDPDVLRGVILEGIPGTAMPPWRPLLSDPEVEWIVDYLLTGEE
ncbi:c-type cytochrome [Marivita sp. S2033]|uniref:c-type cytochrome n=1 Tax=Marivita sp. S2033 TaxID=3373187 RepID=UPI0039822693